MRPAKLPVRSLVVAWAAILAACGHPSGGDAGHVPALPERSGPLTSPDRSSLSLAGEGVPSGTQILIDLATPASPQATWAPWACQGVLPPDFVIGQATCLRDTAKTAPVTAAMAEQVCSGNPDFGAPVGPTAEPKVPGCEKLTLSFYGFSPTLQVQLVAPVTGR